MQAEWQQHRNRAAQVFTNPTDKSVTLKPGDRVKLVAKTREFRSLSRERIPI
jgi:hypothetical protein